MKNARALFSVAAAFLITTAGRAEEVTVTLSDGTNLTMQQPTDLMGATWNNVRSHLPEVFLLVSDPEIGQEAKIKELLVTAGAVGHLYVVRYDKALGVTDDGVDMFKVEETLEKAKRGKVSSEVQRAINQGEAAAFWWAMLQDHAEEQGMTIPDMPAPNTDPKFLEKYLRLASHGDSTDIYAEVLRRAAENDPRALDSYLQSAPSDQRDNLRRILQNRSSDQKATKSVH